MVPLSPDTLSSPLYRFPAGGAGHFNLVLRGIYTALAEKLMDRCLAYMKDISAFLQRPQVNGVCFDYVFSCVRRDLHGVISFVFSLKGNTVNARCQ